MFDYRYCCAIFVAAAVWLPNVATADNLPTCQPRDFHYELTECDPTNGGRWRVSVPTVGSCTGGAPNAPVRLRECSLTCPPGDYFDLEEVGCRECPAGTYSLGGVVRHEIWDQLPNGFSTFVEPLTSRSSFSILERERSSGNCSRSEWQPRGDYIAFPGGPCVASLIYTVRLSTRGTLQYTYQYTDEDAIFEVQVQNELCQNIQSGGDEVRWPTTTEEGKWRTSKLIPLPAGLNVLQWKAMGISGRQTKPLLIKSIEVSGVSDPSASTGCTPCRNGTYAPSKRSSQCIECPANSYSNRGATQCLKCDPKTSYSSSGSSKCHRRPPCTSNDYYEVHSACDERNNTLVTYKWVEPRICRDDLPSAMRLPSGGERRKCPPCNPGMQMDYASGTCQFCPVGTVSDGMRPCRACPPSTAPNTGLQLLWWSALPPGVSARCMSLYGDSGAGCTTAAAWVPSGDHLRTGHGHAPDAYLILSLRIDKGFRPGRSTVSFTFQLDCDGDCQFVFMQSSPTKGVSSIQTWSGRVPRQHFTYTIPQNGSFTFNWVFQKLNWDQDGEGVMADYSPSGVKRLMLTNTDSARIDSINVTNTLEGGASFCLPCAQGADASGCIPCPAGHYTEEATNQCKACPANTVVIDPVAVGPSSCVKCGPGLVSQDGKTCGTNCTPSVNGTRYDLRKIGSKHHEVRGSLLFTASGMQYFHVFNISLCGQQPVNCANNITFQTEGEPKSIQALICRTTLIPSQTSGSSGSVASPLSTQSVTLGDHLVGITREPQLGDNRVLDEFYNGKDLHVFYSTPTITKSCPKGRTTTLTLRCDADQSGTGQVKLPSRCPDGTCDGCHFHFLWVSSTVCPICGPEDIMVVKSECVGGEQNIHYLAPKYCLMAEDAVVSKTEKCSTQIPFYLQVVISSCIGTAILLCLTVFACWKRNRRLEYKYSRLARQRASPSNNSIGSTMLSGEKDNHANDCDSELAAAESCALDDDEEEEEEVSVTVPMKSFGLVNKIRSMTSSKSESGSPFETIQLTEAQS